MQLIGRPYKTAAKGPDKYDCWSLTRAAIEIITGRKIPDYCFNPAAAKLNAFFIDLALNDGTWAEVRPFEITPGLVIAFQYGGPGSITHAAATIGSGQFIQCTEKRGVTIEKITKYQKLIEGFYKYTGPEVKN